MGQRSMQACNRAYRSEKGCHFGNGDPAGQGPWMAEWVEPAHSEKEVPYGGQMVQKGAHRARKGAQMVRKGAQMARKGVHMCASSRPRRRSGGRVEWVVWVHAQCTQG